MMSGVGSAVGDDLSELQVGRRVNLHRNPNHPGVVRPVRCRSTGRPVARTNSLNLAEATFVVQPAGAERARSERVRNVHAFARGVIPAEPGRVWPSRPVPYDPFNASRFTSDGAPRGGSGCFAAHTFNSTTLPRTRAQSRR